MMGAMRDRPPPPPGPAGVVPVATTPHPVLGIALMVGAGFIFSGMDALAKALTQAYPVQQVIWARYTVHLVIVLAYLLAVEHRRLSSLLRSGRPALQLGRSLAVVLSSVFFTAAIKFIPLADATAINFVTPLLVTALSVPLLGEKVGPRRWMAIAVGLVGVLVALRPGGQGVASLAGLAVLAAATGYALTAIMVRILHRTDSSQALVFWMIAMTAALAGLLALPGWVSLQGGDGWVLAGVGLTGFLGQVAITEAFRSGDASVVAPFEYSALAWGLGLDLVVWNTLPDGWTFAGAGIVIASGLYLIHRERVATAQAREEAGS